MKKEIKTEIVSARVEKELKEWVEKTAKELDLTPSEFIYWILRRARRKWGGNIKKEIGEEIGKTTKSILEEIWGIEI